LRFAGVERDPRLVVVLLRLRVGAAGVSIGISSPCSSFVISCVIMFLS
jgi:hypothetical protein